MFVGVLEDERAYRMGPLSLRTLEPKSQLGLDPVQCPLMSAPATQWPKMASSDDPCQELVWSIQWRQVILVLDDIEGECWFENSRNTLYLERIDTQIRRQGQVLVFTRPRK